MSPTVLFLSSSSCHFSGFSAAFTGLTSPPAALRRFHSLISRWSTRYRADRDVAWMGDKSLQLAQLPHWERLRWQYHCEAYRDGSKEQWSNLLLPSLLHRSHRLPMLCVITCILDPLKVGRSKFTHLHRYANFAAEMARWCARSSFA